MPRSHVDILPGALDLTYPQRVEEYVIRKQYEMVEAKSQGVLKHLGGSALETPWSEYMHMMDSIEYADAEPTPDDPGSATLFVRFTSPDRRDQFHDVTESMLSGIADVDGAMPRVRDLAEDERMLRVLRYRYPDVSSAGRMATIFLRKEFMPVMGKQNLRVIQTAPLGALREGGIVSALPDVLQEHVDKLYIRHGDVADNMLLSSGNFGLVGRAMREAHGPGKLSIQRPRSNRPAIEEGVNFRGKGDIPISTTGLSHALGGQLRDRFDDLAEPYKRRNVADAIKNAIELFTGLGGSEGGAALARALFTIVASNTSAIKNNITDGHYQRKGSVPLPKERKTDQGYAN